MMKINAFAGQLFIFSRSDIDKKGYCCQCDSRRADSIRHNPAIKSSVNGLKEQSRTDSPAATIIDADREKSGELMRHNSLSILLILFLLTAVLRFFFTTNPILTDSAGTKRNKKYFCRKE
ncbi:MAG TPA: hypothetical protein PKN04_08315 [bacterium]|nr:hypothetical protein [bacterium]HNT65764.1 hypothetical protein [bacterium]HOX85453.1 hypothetical protein [bacterium]HPG44612.1 hypothetical protein [bacterium]HPM97170.1 hypothetical protein [bacterium]